MLILLSHAAAFSALFVASVWDLKTTEVPDPVLLFGITAGVGLHAAYASSIGSLTPLIWSLTIGTMFFVFGLAAYLLGMWGGADALAISVLGFAAPFPVYGTSFIYPIDMIFNLMIAGFIYTMLFAGYKAYTADRVISGFLERINREEKRLSLEVLSAGLLGALMQIIGANGIFYFLSLISMIFLYRLLLEIEEKALVSEISVEDLEPGDVIEEDFGLKFEDVREKGLLGELIGLMRDKIDLVSSFTNSTFLAVALDRLDSYLTYMENRIGYPKVVGVTDEQIEKIRDSDIEKVRVKSGLRFIPAYPVALLMTDILGIGVGTIVLLV